jgi:hypothetical protein
MGQRKYAISMNPIMHKRKLFMCVLKLLEKMILQCIKICSNLCIIYRPDDDW